MSEFIEISDSNDPSTLWRFEPEFLTSNWTCVWGKGCHGIAETKAAHLGLGCCSLGAELDGIDESMNLSASAGALARESFQYFDAAQSDGIYGNEERTKTRVIDGACIFLNRAGFDGAQGCSLDIAAKAVGESSIDWKPSVCWQLPVHVDWEMTSETTETATVRKWSRADWGNEGENMAWCCTERSCETNKATDEAYVGTVAVYISLKEELTEMVGQGVYDQLCQRLGQDDR